MSLHIGFWNLAEEMEIPLQTVDVDELLTMEGAL